MAQIESNSSQNMDNQPRFPSLNLIFDLTKERLSGQLDQIKNLDSKANFILGAATALVSAALVLQAVLLTAQSTATSNQTTPAPPSPSPLPPYCSLSIGKVPPLPLLVFFAVYIAVIITAFFAYKLRIYKQTPEPNELRETYLQKKEDVTREEIFLQMINVYNHNNRTIGRKIFWLRVTFIVLVCESVALVAVLYIQLMC